jgi:hypothetical protein
MLKLFKKNHKYKELPQNKNKNAIEVKFFSSIVWRAFPKVS